jgi:hypothetical protein
VMGSFGRSVNQPSKKLPLRLRLRLPGRSMSSHASETHKSDSADWSQVHKKVSKRYYNCKILSVR